MAALGLAPIAEPALGAACEEGACRIRRATGGGSRPLAGKALLPAGRAVIWRPGGGSEGSCGVSFEGGAQGAFRPLSATPTGGDRRGGGGRLSPGAAATGGRLGGETGRFAPLESGSSRDKPADLEPAFPKVCPTSSGSSFFRSKLGGSGAPACRLWAWTNSRSTRSKSRCQTLSLTYVFKLTAGRMFFSSL